MQKNKTQTENIPPTEPKEMEIEELTEIAVKHDKQSFVKPKFTYYQVPLHLKPVFDRLDLEFSKEFDENHFKDCPAVREERQWLMEHVQEYFSKEFNDFVEEVLNLGVKFVPQPKYKAWARKMILSQFRDMRCPKEIAAVCDVLNYLVKSYDMENPKIFLLVRELLNQYLMGMRLDKEINDRGMFQTIVTPRGDSITLPHSGMKSKLDFSKLFLEYIQLLDNVTRDSIKFKVEGEVTIPMLMKRINELSDEPVRRFPPTIDITPEKKQIGDSNAENQNEKSNQAT